MATEVPGYVLRDVLGQGPRATVWRGEAIGAPGRMVAIKLVHPAVALTSTLDPADPPAFAARLRHESEILARRPHPHILPVADVVPTDDGVAVVAALASGGSLSSRLAHAPSGASAAEVADLGARLASALATVHDAGVVHRDIRPSNVLFDGDHRPMLGDIGITRQPGREPLLPARVSYLAPELLEGREPDPRSDLFALGVTLRRCRSGSRLDTGDPTGQPEPRPGPRDRALDGPLDAAIADACAPDRDRRPASAHDLAELLEQLREPSPSGGTRATTQPSPRPSGAAPRAGTLGAGPAARHRPRRSLLVAGALGVVLVPGAIATALWLSDPGSGVGGAPAHGEPDGAPALEVPPAVETAARTDRVPAPACDQGLPLDAAGEVLLADLDDLGCSTAILWDGSRLEVPRESGAPEYYDLDAGPGDVLLFGDWNCDGRDAPALYRPGDGQLFTFDRLAGAGQRISALGSATGVVGGTPRAVTDPDGCDHLVVDP